MNSSVLKRNNILELSGRTPGAAAKPQGLADNVRRMLSALGENPEREGLRKTPERVARSLRYLTAGHNINIDKLINGALFDVEYNEMVLVKDISFYSLCEHHLLPFFG